MSALFQYGFKNRNEAISATSDALRLLLTVADSEDILQQCKPYLDLDHIDLDDVLLVLRRTYNALPDLQLKEELTA